MADQFKFLQLQPFTLAGAGAVIGDTSVTLTSMQTIDGVNLAMTDFGVIGYGTLEPDSGQFEEQISFSGITQNSNGTATLTGVKNVLFISPYTETSGLAKTHAGGVQFVISNTSGFYNKLTSKSDDETITGLWDFPSGANNPTIGNVTYVAPTADTQIATKKYIDDIAIAGAPLATNSVFGISKLSVAAASPTVPIAVGDNDSRVSPVSLAALTAGEVQALVGTSGTPSTSNKYVTNDDTAAAATASKVARRNAGGDVTVNTTPTNATDAASKAYVDLTQGHVTGVISDLSTTASGNNDVTVTTTFTPRLIRLHYWIQGHTSASSTNIYTGQKGVAIFEGITFVFSDVSYDGQLTGDQGTPSALTEFVNSVNSTSNPTAGTNSSGTDDIQITLSIASVSSTTFVIRRLTDIGTGANASNARAKIAYEAFA